MEKKMASNEMTDVIIPERNSDYKCVDFWNRRYRLDEDNFDWCKQYKDFKHLMDGVLKTVDRILILGCGNSTLSEDLYADGYCNITNIDYSEVVIGKMSQRSEAARSMKWMVMDMLNMSFDAGSFDVVIEKAAIDSLLVDEKDPWKVSDGSVALLRRLMLQISHLLCPGGRFISITFTQPHFRHCIYCSVEYEWSYKYHTYGQGFSYFFYVMTKGEALDPKHLPTLDNSESTAGDELPLQGDSEVEQGAGEDDITDDFWFSMSYDF